MDLQAVVPYKTILSMFGYDNNFAMSKFDSTIDVGEIESFVQRLSSTDEAKKYGVKDVELLGGLTNFRIFRGHVHTLQAAAKLCQERINVPKSLQTRKSKGHQRPAANLDVHEEEGT